MLHKPVDGFFYGLFMEADLLRKLGVDPVNPRRAFVDDYQLLIGERATLTPSSGSRVYGMAFELKQEELDVLYSTPGLEAYRPVNITAQDMNGSAFSALCYVLPAGLLDGESNPEYATQLREVLGRLEFPAEYIESIS